MGLLRAPLNTFLFRAFFPPASRFPKFGSFFHPCINREESFFKFFYLNASGVSVSLLRIDSLLLFFPFRSSNVPFPRPTSGRSHRSFYMSVPPFFFEFPLWAIFLPFFDRTPFPYWFSNTPDLPLSKLTLISLSKGRDTARPDPHGPFFFPPHGCFGFYLVRFFLAG